jgi:hypothetical protein
LQVIPLKLLSKAPRGCTAKAAHGLKSSYKLSCAEQVQVRWLLNPDAWKGRMNLLEIVAEPLETRSHGAV